VVEELCCDLGVPFVEQQLTLGDCAGADEAMLCGTAFCLAGVRSIAGQPLPWPGPLTLRLLAAWSERVGLDIAAQMTAAG
jgi:branched-subunit amino acid aminotransferase/4-amino-4-deoxychorismate lyase